MLKTLFAPAALALTLVSGAALAADDLKVIRVGTTNLSSDIGLYLADKRGYFAAEGLKVELVPFDSGAKMVAPLGSGDLDAGAGAASAGLYNAVNRGLQLKLVADKGTNIKDYSYKSLTVRKDLVDSGAFKSLADLKGKKVAIIAKGAADESVIHQALLKAGLKDTDIEKVYVPFSSQLTAYANKAIDAAISSEPSTTTMIQNGVAVRFAGIDTFYPVQQTAMLLMNGRFIADKETATKFIKAYLKGVRDYTATLKDGKIQGPNAEEMIQEISNMTGIKDKALLKAAVPVFINPNGAMALDSIKTDLDYFKATGLVGSDIDASKVVDTSLIAAAVAALGSATVPK
ncbi:MAG: ABC transporter substrate-binding protein [Pseudomonadota bacterium]